MIRPPEPTPLQAAQEAFLDVLSDARADLDPEQFRVWVDTVIASIAVEAARCANWERRQRGEGP